MFLPAETKSFPQRFCFEGLFFKLVLDHFEMNCEWCDQGGGVKAPLLANQLENLTQLCKLLNVLSTWPISIRRGLVMAFFQNMTVFKNRNNCHPRFPTTANPQQ